MTVYQQCISCLANSTMVYQPIWRQCINRFDNGVLNDLMTVHFQSDDGELTTVHYWFDDGVLINLTAVYKGRTTWWQCIKSVSVALPIRQWCINQFDNSVLIDSTTVVLINLTTVYQSIWRRCINQFDDGMLIALITVYQLSLQTFPW